MLIMQWVWKVFDRIPWVAISLVTLVHFAITWFMIFYFEPNTEIVQADIYWWFYLVTASTVGYGDFSPITLGGRIATAIIIVGGIILMSAVFGKIAQTIVNLWNKRKTGMAQLKLTNHTIVIGDGSVRTAKLIRNLGQDVSCKEIVLVSDSVTNQSETKFFVSGSITDIEVQKRSCLNEADTIIVVSESDAESIGRVIAILKKIHQDAKIVVFLSEDSIATDVFDIDTRIRTVTSIDMDAIVQEAQDPGAGSFAKKILNNGEEGTYFRLSLPEDISLKTDNISQKLLRQGVTLVGIYSDDEEVQLIMDPDIILKGGTVLAVIALDREKLNMLVW